MCNGVKSDNKKLISRCRLIQNIKNVPENDIIEPINEIEYDNVTKNMKKIYKNSDGFYYIDMIKYTKCFGSRDEVWGGDAYKTTGGLKKTDLILNKYGNIVSKKKFISEKTTNRFITSSPLH
jgi:hypothetical protein